MYRLGFSDGLPLLPQRDQDDSVRTRFHMGLETQCRAPRLALESRSVGLRHSLVIKQQEKRCRSDYPKKKAYSIQNRRIISVFFQSGGTLTCCSAFIGRTAPVLKDRL